MKHRTNFYCGLPWQYRMDCLTDHRWTQSCASNLIFSGWFFGEVVVTSRTNRPLTQRPAVAPNDWSSLLPPPEQEESSIGTSTYYTLAIVNVIRLDTVSFDNQHQIFQINDPHYKRRRLLLRNKRPSSGGGDVLKTSHPARGGSRN